MNVTDSIIFLLLGIGIYIPIHFAFVYFFIPRSRTMRLIHEPFNPFVSVVIPCKGTGEEFEKFLRTLDEQIYDKAEYLFCFADSFDPGIETIKKNIHVINYRFCFAKSIKDTSAKIENLTTGLEDSLAEASVIVFLDSDGSLISRQHIRALVTPLADPYYICSSTFRIYEAKTLGGMLAKYWNYILLYFRDWPGATFVWGGGMAIRKTDLELLNIPQIWHGNLVEDMPTTKKIKQLKREVYRVNEYVISEANYTVSEAMKWIRRQNLYSFLYCPEFHYVSLFYQTLVFSYLGLFLFTQQWLLLSPLLGFYLFISLLTLKHGELNERLLSPWISLMLTCTYFWMMLSLPKVRSINWAGIDYQFDKFGRIIKRNDPPPHHPTKDQPQAHL